MDQQDTEYEITPKGEEMAQRLALSRGIKSLLKNKNTPTSSPEQTGERISKVSSKDPTTCKTRKDGSVRHGPSICH